jgi:hypothetical protein
MSLNIPTGMSRATAERFWRMESDIRSYNGSRPEHTDPFTTVNGHHHHYQSNAVAFATQPGTSFIHQFLHNLFFSDFPHHPRGSF